MSQNLYWRPINRTRHYVGDSKLRELLRDKGFLRLSDLDYLRGLRDAGVTDAGKLIEAVEKHEEIELGVE